MEVQDFGADNVINVPDSINGRVIVHGSHNAVHIQREHASQNVHVEVHGTGSVVEIGAGCTLGHLHVYTWSNGAVRLGDFVSVSGLVRLMVHEPAGITIGRDCLISGGTDITVSDMHPIFDLETDERINPAASVHLGEHCWIGQNSLILKGAQIGDGCVIGAHSVVTGSIANNCLAVGSPAKVVRAGIYWKREL